MSRKTIVNFIESSLIGAYIIEPTRLDDERGFFARSWCQREFEQLGLNHELVQCNISYNLKQGTLRGMHFQRSPHRETKLVRCTKGAIFDVIIDLRSDSPTYLRWTGVELSADNHRMLYVPEQFAHGFQTLTDSSEVFYQMSEFHSPGSASGLRWNDPLFDIAWPFDTPILSDRDRSYPDFHVNHSTRAA